MQSKILKSNVKIKFNKTIINNTLKEINENFMEEEKSDKEKKESKKSHGQLFSNYL